MASVSASHSCGNSWATWETGQCCWHSCSPTTGRSRTDAAYPSSVKICGERLDRAEVRVGRERVVEPLLDERHAAVREFPDGALAAGLGQEPQRLRRQVVVLLVEVVAPGLGQGEQLGGPAAPPGGGGARLARLEHALLEEVVEVAAYGGRGQVEPLGESGGGRGPVDQDRAHDSLARRLVAGRHELALVEFHNISVPLLLRPLQVRTALPTCP